MEPNNLVIMAIGLLFVLNVVPGGHKVYRQRMRLSSGMKEGMNVDDLISRKAAIDALNINGCCGMGIQYIVDCDSVPAVPLDKLCAWLGKSPVHPCQMRITPCVFEKDGRDAECRPNAECWKEAINKWMEEQNA